MLLLFAAYLQLILSSCEASVLGEKPSGVAGEPSQSKQFPIPYPLPPQPPVRFIPVNAVRRAPPIRQREGFAQPSSSSSGIFSFILAFIFSQFLTTTTTPARTTARSPCVVAWGTWGDCNLQDARYRNRTCPTGVETERGDCSIECGEYSSWTACVTPTVVDEKRVRTRQCKTGFQTVTEACYSSTTKGYTSDGWYRASNGYEYRYISTATDFDLAVATCEGWDPSSTLATVGARSGIIGSDLDAAGMGIADGVIYFVGATDATKDGTWIFKDGVVLMTTAITNWGQITPTEPNGGTSENCMVWLQAGGTTMTAGLGDAPCTSRPALCERKVPDV